MIRKILSTLKQLRSDHEDARIGRQLVGKDRFGNIYYQYYDQYGKETRRQMERLNINSTQIVDPLWEDWIRGVQKKPYTEEELNEIYQTEIQQQKIIHDYEKRDSEMMKKYREEQKQKSREKDYKADQWDPFKK